MSWGYKTYWTATRQADQHLEQFIVTVNQNWDQHWPAVQEDAEKIKTLEQLTDSGFQDATADATDFLRSIALVPIEVAKDSPIDQQIRDLIPKVAKIDTAWMKDLYKYSYANATKNPETIDADDFDYKKFQLWVKVRLVQGIIENRIPEALADTRRLTTLLSSTNTMIGKMVAVANLSIEHKIQQYALFVGFTSEEVGHQIDPDLLWRAKRFYFATPAIYNGIFFDEPRHSKAEALGLGKCVAVVEKTMGLLRLKDIVQRGRPKEFEMQRHFVSKYSAECRSSGLLNGLDNASLLSKFAAQQAEVLASGTETSPAGSTLLKYAAAAATRFDFAAKLAFPILATTAVPNFYLSYGLSKPPHYLSVAIEEPELADTGLYNRIPNIIIPPPSRKPAFLKAPALRSSFRMDCIRKGGLYRDKGGCYVRK